MRGSRVALAPVVKAGCSLGGGMCEAVVALKRSMLCTDVRSKGREGQQARSPGHGRSLVCPTSKARGTAAWRKKIQGRGHAADRGWMCKPLVKSLHGWLRWETAGRF